MGAVDRKLASSWEITSSVSDMNPLSSVAAKVRRGLSRFRHGFGPLSGKNMSSGLGGFCSEISLIS